MFDVSDVSFQIGRIASPESSFPRIFPTFFFRNRTSKTSDLKPQHWMSGPFGFSFPGPDVHHDFLTFRSNRTSPTYDKLGQNRFWSKSDYSDVQFQIGRIGSAESSFSTLFWAFFRNQISKTLFEIRFQRHPISNHTLNVLLSVGSKSDSDFGSDGWDVWSQKK